MHYISFFDLNIYLINFLIGQARLNYNATSQMIEIFFFNLMLEYLLTIRKKSLMSADHKYSIPFYGNSSYSSILFGHTHTDTIFCAEY